MWGGQECGEERSVEYGEECGVWRAWMDSVE